jgi:MFS family permease
MHSRLADSFGYLLFKTLAHNSYLIFSQTCTNSLIVGVGGGGLVGLTYVIVTDMVSLRERGKWMAIIVLQWAVGSVSGPVIGTFDFRSTLPLSTP